MDVQHLDEQVTDSVGGVSVGLSSGEAFTSWTSHVTVSSSGAAGFSLTWRPSDVADPAVPPGWRLAAASGSNWDGLAVTADGTVTLLAKSGATLPYRKAGTVWVPVLASPGAVGGTAAQGSGTASAVTQNADGTWTVTDPNQTTTTFTATSATNTTGYLSSVTQAGILVAAPVGQHPGGHLYLRHARGQGALEGTTSRQVGQGECPGGGARHRAAPVPVGVGMGEQGLARLDIYSLGTSDLFPIDRSDESAATEDRRYQRGGVRASSTPGNGGWGGVGAVGNQIAGQRMPDSISSVVMPSSSLRSAGS